MRRAAGPALAVAVALGAAASAASAQSVSLAGSLGNRALLVIDGKTRQVAVGASEGGVKVVSVSGSEAVVEIGGKRVALVAGAAPVNLGGAPSAGTGSRIVLTADLGGHFFASGSINGTSVRFVVDTGATSVAMGRGDAERIGLDWKKGELGFSQTANGTVPVSRVSLTTVRIGDVEVHNVQATVLPQDLGHVLLGNTFLQRFQMRRENDQMTLERRF